MTLPDRPFAWYELDQLGLTRHDLRRMLAAHDVRRLLQGVYAPADLDDTPDLRARAVALVLRDHMVLADRTAAWLHGIDRYRPADLRGGPPPLDIVSIDRARATRRRDTFGGNRALEPADLCVIEGVRVTTPVRTAADLACRFGRRDALAVLDAFMRVCGVSRAELDALLPRFQGRRGVVQLRELVPLATPLSESPGESWVRIDIHDAGLPAPEPQFPVLVNGIERFRLDLAYPAWKIVVEYDGVEHHTSPGDRARDGARRDWLRRHGWIVIVVTKDDFTGSAEGAWLREVRVALDERIPRRSKRRYARTERVLPRRRSS